MAKMLHRIWDVVWSAGKQYTAPNAAADAILNMQFYRDIIEGPKPT